MELPEHIRVTHLIQIVELYKLVDF